MHLVTGAVLAEGVGQRLSPFSVPETLALGDNKMS